MASTSIQSNSFTQHTHSMFFKFVLQDIIQVSHCHGCEKSMHIHPKTYQGSMCEECECFAACCRYGEGCLQCLTPITPFIK